MFHGFKVCKSEPTTNTGVISPLGRIQPENPMTSGMASATPVVAATRVCLLALSSDGSSKHFVPWRMTHRSADV